jgi:hydroxymethylbilane synthase
VGSPPSAIQFAPLGQNFRHLDKLHSTLPLPTYTFNMASATATNLDTPSQNAPQAATTSASTQFSQVNIGTRNSALAQIQARAVAAALKQAHPERTYNICPVVVEGDRDKITPLQQLSQGENAKSLWTGELESMLEKGDLDIIVHCLKGMSTSMLHVQRYLLAL